MSASKHQGDEAIICTTCDDMGVVPTSSGRGSDGYDPCPDCTPSGTPSCRCSDCRNDEEPACALVYWQGNHRVQCGMPGGHDGSCDAFEKKHVGNDRRPGSRSGARCTWCHGSGEWVERKQIVPCNKCNGVGW